MALMFPRLSVIATLITLSVAASIPTPTSTKGKVTSHDLNLRDLALPPEVITEALFGQVDQVQDELEQCEEMVRNQLKDDSSEETRDDVDGSDATGDDERSRVIAQMAMASFGENNVSTNNDDVAGDDNDDDDHDDDDDEDDEDDEDDDEEEEDDDDEDLTADATTTAIPGQNSFSLAASSASETVVKEIAAASTSEAQQPTSSDEAEEGDINLRRRRSLIFEQTMDEVQEGFNPTDTERESHARQKSSLGIMKGRPTTSPLPDSGSFVSADTVSQNDKKNSMYFSGSLARADTLSQNGDNKNSRTMSFSGSFESADTLSQNDKKNSATSDTRRMSKEQSPMSDSSSFASADKLIQNNDKKKFVTSDTRRMSKEQILSFSRVGAEPMRSQRGKAIHHQVDSYPLSGAEISQFSNTEMSELSPPKAELEVMSSPPEFKAIPGVIDSSEYHTGDDDFDDSLYHTPSSAATVHHKRTRRGLSDSGSHDPERFVPLIGQLVDRLKYLKHSLAVCRSLLLHSSAR